MFTLIFRYYLLHFLDYSHIVIVKGYFIQILLVLKSKFIRILSYCCHLYFRMNSRFGLFCIIKNLLIKFLSITKSCKLNFNVLCTR